MVIYIFKLISVQFKCIYFEHTITVNFYKIILKSYKLLNYQSSSEQDSELPLSSSFLWDEPVLFFSDLRLYLQLYEKPTFGPVFG